MTKPRSSRSKPSTSPKPSPPPLPLPMPNIELVPQPARGDERATAAYEAMVDAVKHLRVSASVTDEARRDLHMLAADVIYGVLRAFERRDVDALREPMTWARADLERHNDRPWFGASSDDRVEAQIQLLRSVEAILSRYRPELAALVNTALARKRRQRHEQPGPSGPTVAVVSEGRAAIQSKFTVPDDLEHAPVVTHAALDLALCLQNAVVLPIVPPLPADAVTRIANVLVALAGDGRLEVCVVTRKILRELGATNPKPDDLFRSKPVEAWLESHSRSQESRNG